MSGDPDWKLIQTAISAQLEPGESVEGLFTAVVPDENRGRGVSYAGLWPIIMAVEFAMRRGSVQEAASSTGVPLAQRMIIALTPQRLVIGAADRRWRLREISGDLPLDQIGNIDFGGASSRTRSVTLQLTSGKSVSLRMPRASADRLRDRLTGSR